MRAAEYSITTPSGHRGTQAVAEGKLDPDDASALSSPAQQPSVAALDAELPAEYLRADSSLLVDSIGLSEPYDPTHTAET
ncbi:MAG: hypothetical protein M3Y42_00155 [Actinomycetota bacterium]|nr:hypothetical protein [Actinomycetota bacterium]MDQ2955366.1 hypothetical protein [Actinomycetota bacterium]